MACLMRGAARSRRETILLCKTTLLCDQEGKYEKDVRVLSDLQSYA